MFCSNYCVFFFRVPPLSSSNKNGKKREGKECESASQKHTAMPGKAD